MGTPEFAVASLEALIKNKFQVVAVVTAPDKPAGRGQLMQESAVKKAAVNLKLPVLQPLNLKDEFFIKELKQFKADLQIVVAFRMLPEIVWNMPPLGTYNLHASLLPNYRGAAPINWAIINGEKQTGLTTFKLVHEIDAGNILMQKTVQINEETTAGTLHDHMMHVGADLLVKTVSLIQNSFVNKSELQFKQQDVSQISHAPKIYKETCLVNWNKDALSVYNLIRGLSPYPTAYTELIKNHTKLTVKLFETSYEIAKHNFTNGFLITDNKSFIKVCVNNGYILLHNIQLQGKKRMGVEEFLRGFKFEEKAEFTS